MAKRKSSRSNELTAAIIPDEVDRSIIVIRGHKVLLDEQLAAFYGVGTKRLIEAVKRNIDRFPEDFMFQLTPEEWGNLRSQFATSSSDGYGGRRYAPYAFTEQGVNPIKCIALITSVCHYLYPCPLLSCGSAL